LPLIAAGAFLLYKMAAPTVNTKHEQAIIKAIQENPVYSFSDIFVFYSGCSRATAYNHNLDKIDSIKEAIHHNKRKAVTTMLKKWIDGDNATLQIAAMRMVAEIEERQNLNQQYIDHTSKGDKISIIFEDGSKD
jgi:hypothetical protein